MFGTSGIRGLYGTEVTVELAMKVGNAAGSLHKKLIIASDTRATSPILANALASGAMQAGCDVIDMGVAPTPLLAYATWKEKCAGAMITASHNPPEYNGIKLFSNGMEFTRSSEQEIEKAVKGGWKTADWKKAGQLSAQDYSQEYISFLLSKVDAAAIRRSAPKVLVDAGNAAAYSLGPALLEAAGCKVVRHLCGSPGKFSRNLEPKASTLSEAAERVKKEKCGFGIAFDGDGDRAIAIDEKGQVLPLDTQLSLFCSHFLSKYGRKGGKIVTTVEASLCVRETVESLGGTLSVTPVGSLHVAQAVLKEKAAFGGEPCGEYVYPFSVPCADGCLSALFIAEIFAQSGKLSALSSMVKTNFVERRKYKCDEHKKQAIMQSIAQKPQLEGRLSTVDGLRYDFSDGWLLIRPSGTEPAIRLTSEAKTQKRLSEIVQRAEQIIMGELHKAS